MAIDHALASIQIQDAVGEVTSFDQPFNYDSATATLAGIISWVQGLAVSLDTVTEGKITKIRVSLLIPLPSGLKTAAVTNSDNEETGLITESASGTPNAFGVDVPAFLQSKFSGNQINLTDTVVAAFTTYLQTLATGGLIGSDRYGNALSANIRGVKTFRKHRRALRRA